MTAVHQTGFESFSEDASGYRGETERVLTPATVEEVQQIVQAAVEQNVPLTASGAGTGLTGARVPHGGWVVSLREFGRLEIEPGVAHAGTGVLLQEVQHAAQKSRQFFGPNPTESAASIGGIINTNASGSRSFRYGSVRGHVLGLEAVFMDGSVRRFRRGDRVDFPIQPVRRAATRKNSAGYYLQPDLEWIDLLCGSEGTLAIITEADLRLIPDPAAILSGIIFFHTDADALDAVDNWRTLPGVRLLEYFDVNSIELVRDKTPGIPPGAQSGLLVEQDLAGDDDPELDRWITRLSAAHAYENESWFGMTQGDRDRFHRFRHSLATNTLDRVRRNGFNKYGTDFAVPVDRSREFLRFYREQCDREMPGRYVMYGHIGDANTHLNLFPETQAQVEVCDRLIAAFARYAIELGGTVAAEHGIGKIKTHLFREMYRPAEIDAMLDVKRRLDPKGLLGRGNIFGEL
jgi:FAD/FMN-containing dehydrogenase